MHFLFVKERLAWPRSSGHDVHAYHMMRALAELGHEVSLMTRFRPSVEAVKGLTLTKQLAWTPQTPSSGIRLSGLQERFRSYWGIEQESIVAVAQQARECAVDVVVAVGLEALPLLAGVRNAQRVWYAADEWVWHHLSLVRLAEPGTWGHIRTALIKGLYEFAFRTVVDRAWVVSAADRRALRLCAQIGQVDVIPNGVDTDHYSPQVCDEAPYSCVFWGRLDFEPNIQALDWFCRVVWPGVRTRVPTAQFRIFGFQPNAAMLKLAELPGVSVVPDVPDLRLEISRSQVVVLPFQSGGGVKNKLLEAAAMSRAIICSSRARNGLTLGGEQALASAHHPQQWVDTLAMLWESKRCRKDLGDAARRWVLSAHSWESSAQTAVRSLVTHATHLTVAVPS